MKLSEAILLGSTVVKPSDDPVFYRKNINDCEFGCAIGMAAKAAGLLNHLGHIQTKTYIQWPWLHQRFETPCGCPYSHDPIGENGFCNDGLWTISHLYEAHVMNRHSCYRKPWTLEQLVDWVRIVEPEENNGQEISPEVQPVRVETVVAR